jgi:nucleotide-binding universal stress UspA family protein
MRLLVAMDDSEFAQRALEQAIRTAKLETAELIVITVIPHMGVIDELPAGFVGKMRKAAESLLASAAAKAEAEGIKTTRILEESTSPADSIIGCAEECKADLIVMGHRGKAKLAKFLLGSVAFRVISQAPCSVLVIK